MATPAAFSPETLQEAEELAASLGTAVGLGDREGACRCVEQLADLRVPLSVRVTPDVYPKEEIRLKVGVEDAQADASIPVAIVVTSDMTITELKDKVNRDYGFHPSLQTWVIGKRLAQGPETLFSLGVRKDGDAAFLYIRSAQQAQLTREQEQYDQEQQRLGGERPRPPETAEHPTGTSQTLKDSLSYNYCSINTGRTMPGCEMCSADRPAGYQVPAVYQPDEDEARRLQQEEAACQLYQQALEEERTRNFEELLQTDQHSLVPNRLQIDCPICYVLIEPGEGATLRECLHSFCKDCLKGTIVNSTDAEVACPYSDNDFACNGKLQDREIRSLLSLGERSALLLLYLLSLGERSALLLLCSSPWGSVQPSSSSTSSPWGSVQRSSSSQAIHEGMNCREYQDDLRVRAQNDVAARQTSEMLKAMVESGEAMHCPRCQVIVQKKDGCDWICCLMCKTEICWVTRGPRWGPQGQGDTSGGCRCRVNGVPCHPNCQNCH
uniref:RanBP-type and C3HC4-type zinc finger containing 1 n=1 Tax=Lepisosteus oculatus TaxID=7918 RepID=W5MI33_LEPOC